MQRTLSSLEPPNKRQRLEYPLISEVINLRIPSIHELPDQSLLSEVLTSSAVADQCSGVHISDTHSIFSHEVSACIQKDRSSDHPHEDCDNIRIVHLDDGSSVTIGDEIGSGGYAYVYATNRSDIVMKISMKRPLCSEKAILSILTDSNIAPVSFPFSKDTSISPYCHARVVLMNRVGDMDWERAYSPFYTSHPPDIPVSYCRMARLLQIVKQLHMTGFVHRDIHDENIRLSSSDPRKTWLIDFGKVRYLTEKDRLNDLRAVAKLAPRGDQFLEFFKSVFDQDNFKFSACDYDRWIDQFLLLAIRNHFTDCI